MSATGTLTPAMQDYLEAIYHLERERNVARVKDIAKRLHVKRPSVSGALKALKSRGLINHEDYGHATLTAQGQELAQGICERHEAVREFLITILQIDENRAEEEACRLEHSVSGETLKRLLCLIDFVENCPRGGQEWLKRLSGRWDDFQCEGCCEDCVAGIAIPAEAACLSATAEV